MDEHALMAKGYWGRRSVIVSVVMVFLMFWASSGWAMRVAEVPNPQTRGGWVSDTIDILPDVMEQSIHEKLTLLEQETGIEVALVTVETVDAPTAKDFATELFNVWGIGKRDRNNGLLILLVRGERRLEMETGYGLESVLTDGWLKRMQESKMVPHFKDGRYDLGLDAGVDEVLTRLRLSPEELAEYEASEDYGHDYDEDGQPWWLYFFGLGAGGTGLGFAGKRYRYKRARTCKGCRKPMEMIPDGEDEKYLNAGEIAEQRVDSVDYQLYFCRDCGLERRLVVNSWFSSYSACKKCGYKTLKSTSVTLVEATTSSTGVKEVTEDCKHCDYHDVRRVTIPRVTESSSSGGSFGGGSSGGGSFGGGSSGGGGAGSSW